jgi:hypothetical protein
MEVDPIEEADQVDSAEGVEPDVPNVGTAADFVPEDSDISLFGMFTNILQFCEGLNLEFLVMLVIYLSQVSRAMSHFGAFFVVHLTGRVFRSTPHWACLGILRANKAAVSQVVTEWMAEYEEEQQFSTIKLIEFFLRVQCSLLFHVCLPTVVRAPIPCALHRPPPRVQSCGCEGAIDPETFEECNIEEVIEHLQAAFSDETVQKAMLAPKQPPISPPPCIRPLVSVAPPAE